jgi:hypothetical protein
MRRFFAVLLIAGLMIGTLGINGFAKDKDRAKFRVRLLYPIQGVVSNTFSAKDNEFFDARRFESYFGKWSVYACTPTSNEGWLGTFSELNYSSGDSVMLRQMRRVASNQVGRNFGIETEIRTGNWWLGIGYVRLSSFAVVTVEEVEKMTFLEWSQTYEGTLCGIPYYEYYMKLLRQSAVQTSNEKFGGSNFQSYLKYEFGSGSSWVGFSAGIGLDLLRVIHQVQTDRTIYSQMPWTANIIDSREENTKSVDAKYYFLRPFVMGDLHFSISRRIDLGIQAKIYRKEQTISFTKDFLLPPADWKMKARFSSVSLYLSFAL